ncbi:MAG: hypothetical protein VB959_25050, partial [Rhodospirillales bacterium]
EIFDWNYETVVSDTETETRRLIDYLGLGWDPACLDFHAGQGAVQSASKWQVRRPVTSASVGRWRDFARELSPLIDALGAAIYEPCAIGSAARMRRMRSRQSWCQQQLWL